MSKFRADPAKNELDSGAVEPERITAFGMGEAEPIEENETPTGRSVPIGGLTWS